MATKMKKFDPEKEDCLGKEMSRKDYNTTITAEEIRIIKILNEETKKLEAARKKKK